ncbi:proline-rich transmembrane 1-like, partial [Paramuricea clavata]
DQLQLPTAVNAVVNNQMKLSIIACLFSCWPIAIFAIIKSCKARNRYKAGDYAGAMVSARKARNLAYAAQVCGWIVQLTVMIIKILRKMPLKLATIRNFWLRALLESN